LLFRTQVLRTKEIKHRRHESAILESRSIETNTSFIPAPIGYVHHAVFCILEPPTYTSTMPRTLKHGAINQEAHL
jgi:hypothetical protein